MLIGSENIKYPNTIGTRVPSITETSSIIYALFRTTRSQLTTKKDVLIPENADVIIIDGLSVRCFTSLVKTRTTKLNNTHRSIRMPLSKTALFVLAANPLIFLAKKPFVAPQKKCN